MALVPFSSLSVALPSVLSAAEDIDDLLASILGDVNNGLERLGWTHLSDRGLSETEFISVHKDWYRPDPMEINVPAGASTSTVFEENKEHFTLRSGLRLARQIAADFGGVRAGLQAREPNLEEHLLDELAYGACMVRAYVVKTGAVDREYRVCTREPDHADVLKAAAWIKDRKPLATAAIGLLVHHAKLKYASNHAVGGSILPGAVLASYGRAVGLPDNAFKGAHDKVRRAVTSAVYLGVHAFSTLAALLLAHDSTTTSESKLNIIGKLRLPTFEKDDQLEMRRWRVPAGYAAMGAVRTVVKLIADDGILACCPARGVLANLTNDMKRIRRDPLAFHPAAGYCGLKTQKIDPTPYKDALPHLAAYLASTGKLPTLLASPVMATALSSGTTASWKNLCDSLAMSGLSSDPKVTMGKLMEAGVVVHKGVNLDDKQSILQAQMEDSLCLQELIDAGL